MTDPIDKVTAGLARLGHQLRGDPASTNGAMSKCPAHEDGTASLKVTVTADGTVVLFCHAGCETQAVVDTIGLTMADLFPAKSARHEVADIYYVYETDPPSRKVRTFPRDFYQQHQRPDGKWVKGGVPTEARLLYRRPEVLAAAKAAGTIYVAEGEKDAESLRAEGVVATTNVEGASKGKSKWLPRYSQDFKGAAQVVVVADRDKVGYNHARQVAESLRSVVDDVVIVRAVEGKDVTDHLVAGYGIDDLVPVGDDESPPADEAEAEAEIGASFERVDLGPYLDGKVTKLKADMLVMTNNQALLHRGRLNGVHGDSGTGKSWLMAYLLRELLAAGQVVMVLDLEDTPDPLIERLRQIGVSDLAIREQVVFIRPDEPFSFLNVERLIEQIVEYGVTHLIFDSLGEAFSLEGLNEDKDVEVAPWIRRVCRRIIERTSAGVTLIDHGTKSAEKPLDPSGSKRKKAAITGTAWLMTSTTPFDRATGGVALLRCAKDRHGWFKKGEDVAALVMTGVDPMTGKCLLRLEPQVPAAKPPPNSDLAAVCAVLNDLYPKWLTKRAVMAEVRRRGGQMSNERGLGAIDLAVVNGDAESRKGPRNSTEVRAVKAP